MSEAEKVVDLEDGTRVIEFTPENVYQKINRVMAILLKDGIGKQEVNGLNYAFRGVDQVYNALAPAMSEVGLLILPKVLERTVSERPSKSGGILTFAVLTVRYTFVSIDDGSSHKVVTLGEAMDAGDKATNKAMSAAYKYACFQTFCIPVDGQDSELDSPEVSSVDMKQVHDIIATLDEIFEVDAIEKTVNLINFEDAEKQLSDICDLLSTDSEMYVKVWDEISRQFTTKLDGRSTVASKMRSYIKEFNKGRQ